jgi:hypothetical protein
MWKIAGKYPGLNMKPAQKWSCGKSGGGKNCLSHLPGNEAGAVHAEWFAHGSDLGCDWGRMVA